MAAAEAVVEVEPPEKAGAARHERQLGGGGGAAIGWQAATPPTHDWRGRWGGGVAA